jgi:outer membrane protein assembly factor BamB
MNSDTKPELWSVCPLCYQPNPKGTSFCKYCWAMLDKVDNWVSYEEAKEISKVRSTKLKRKKLIKMIAFTFIPVILFVSAVFLGIFYFTDIIDKPVQVTDSNSMPGEWAMFRHDITHSGATGQTDIEPQGTIKWTFLTGGAVHSSPAIAYDTVYFGSTDSNLYAVDIHTGEIRWKFKAGSWVESSPAIVDGVVYFGSNDGYLYAVDADNGEKLWEFETDYPIMSSPAVADGIVFFGGDDYYIYALDAKTGEKLWHFKTNGLAKSPPTVANGIVYIGGGSDYLLALNASNGRLRLNFKAHYSVYSSAVVVDDVVYFCNSHGYLYAIDGKARSWPREHEFTPLWFQLWGMGIPGVPEPPLQSGYIWAVDLVGRRTVSAMVNSSPVLDNNALYIGVDKNLIAVDLENQQVLWKFATGDTVSSSPALTGGIIYVGSEDGRLYAVDAATGEKVWDFLTGDKISSSPAVVDGVIYIGSNDGNLYAIE